MSSVELTLFSYEVLGLIGRDGAGPHDLRRMVRARPHSSTGPARAATTSSRSDSQRSATWTARREPGKTRERTVYTLTEKGLDALRAWAATPDAVHTR